VTVKLRLNLGAGDRLLQHELLPGILDTEFVQHEKPPRGGDALRPEIDVAWDLNVLPWPWENNRFTRIEAWAVFEHLHITLVEALDECWRIMRPNGKLHVKVPHWKHGRAHMPPDHVWHGWEYSPFWWFDPQTKYGQRYESITPYKWRLTDQGWTDKKRTAFWANLRKRTSGAQWGEILQATTIGPPGFVIWLTGRSQAGKSTVAKGLAALFARAVYLDDEVMWDRCFEPTLANMTLKGEPGVNLFKHESGDDPHRDFAIPLARFAAVLAAQGHMVIVSMVGSPEARRARIDKLCSPSWFYVKRESGEHKLPLYDPPETWDVLIDCDKLGRKPAIAKAAAAVIEIRRKLSK
jgi:hypothetical protein